ncbi:transporter substrate-binding domain-containing protein [Duganella sp. FT80W]|uniref:Transporter substrate-binding domain-containing protein n=1 Tax=Duganella guangzhouensis TaxID=2666084 RepID=A0A6I2L7H6_9BURK|nr:transporter substrate-binding domain-containing protein [Duganella guangzhouensis]MRW93710.1 transporter substrate-binding domain-containing protein [Duganella guangzhouensis]
MQSSYTPVSRRDVLLALAALALSARGVRAANAAMAYLYYEWGRTPKRDDYQVAALTLALKKTEPAYGAFSVTRVPDNMSTMRVWREVHLGQRLNVHVGPWRSDEGSSGDERNILVSTPIMGGLLGYRQLIVRQEDLQKFSTIVSQAQLKRLTAGQGRSWVDVKILRHNGYKVQASGNMETLVEMLATKRFDYLPCSVVEVDSLLEQHPRLTSGLTVVPDLLLYYPLPTMFYISANQPRMAERLEAGLAAVKRDGSLDALTARHFQKEIRQLQSGSSRCFVLDNPLLPPLYANEPPSLLRKNGG